MDSAPDILVRSIPAIITQCVASLLPLDSIHLTPVRGMQRRLHPSRSLVHLLDHVDLAVHGPVVCVGEPHGGPGSAAVGRVLYVEEEESGVPAGFRVDAGSVSAVGRVAPGSGVVDAEKGGCRGLKSEVADLNVGGAVVDAGGPVAGGWVGGMEVVEVGVEG